MFHQELDDSALRTAAEALVTVALWVDDERAHRLVVVEWAKRLIPYARLLQSVGVVAAVRAEAVTDDLLNLRRVHYLLNSKFINLRHGLFGN